MIGPLPAVTAALVAAGCGTGLNTACVERLNATVRAGIAPLARRCWRLVRTDARLHAWL